MKRRNGYLLLITILLAGNLLRLKAQTPLNKGVPPPPPGAQIILSKPTDPLFTYKKVSLAKDLSFGGLIFRTPDGKGLPFAAAQVIYFYVNGNVYSQSEIEALDKTMALPLLRDPSTKYGLTRLDLVDLGPNQVKIDQNNPLKRFTSLIWFGSAPPPSAWFIRFKELSAKYARCRLTGLVKEYFYSNSDKSEATGFLFESGENLIKISIETLRAKELLRYIVPGDILTIKLGAVNFFKDLDPPSITPDNIIKEGEVIFADGHVQI